MAIQKRKNEQSKRLPLKDAKEFELQRDIILDKHKKNVEAMKTTTNQEETEALVNENKRLSIEMENLNRKANGMPLLDVEKEMEPKKNTEPVVTTDVIGDKVRTIMHDSEGHMIAIDFFKINTIHRFSYNVIMNEMLLVLPETVGRIGEQDTPIYNNKGEKTSGMRRSIKGDTTAFKTKISGTEAITAFLKAWLKVETIDEALFPGLVEHERQVKQFEEAMEKKRQEEEQEKQPKSKILDMNGEAIK